MHKKTILASLLILTALLLFTSPSNSSSPPAPPSPKPDKSSGVQDQAEKAAPTVPLAFIDTKSKTSSAADINTLQATPEEKRFISKRQETGATKTASALLTKDGRSYPLRTYKTMLTPNDPLYSQWWITPNDMTSVWDMPAPTRSVKIAVIDTGFALNHQEFNGRWAINQGESGPASSEAPSDLNCTDQNLAINKLCNNIDDNFDGIVDNESGSTTAQNPSRLNCTAQNVSLDKFCNLIDDDTNGYIDDYRGWDFANFDNSVQAGEVQANGSGTTHGTRVAGVLGATGNNGVGTAGVNWYASILPIQALDDFSYGDTYTVSEAVYYAADHGADIISISLGAAADDPYLRQAILYALDKGSIIVAASGNDGCNCISYPANYPEVIAVGALGTNGSPASFSSYGAQLDLLAPGQSMSTPTYTAANQTSAYTTASGTSFATPFVSGLLGLARASQPDAQWEEIIGAMLENADRTGLSLAAPHSTTLGFGAANANAMLNRLRTPNLSVQRTQFGGGTILGSLRSYQCDGTIPGNRLYELTKSGLYRYTSNLRELSKATSQGWSAQMLAYTCIGLPTDTVTMLRVVDIPSETRNLRIKQ